MRCFKCHKFGHGKDKCRRPNSLCGRCGKEHADQHQCTAAAHCINCKGDHPAFSKQCPKFLEEQAILRYKAEHGGTFQQARAAVIVDTPRAVSSRTYAQATKVSLKSSKATQPKASDKVSASVTSKANAQRHTPPSSPKGAVSRPADKPREPINRFGNVSDMDIDSISDYLSDERKSRSRNTRSLERPLPLSQSQPQSPARSRSRARPLPPPHSPTHHIPPLIPPTADGDPIPVNSPPPPPARYPTSPQGMLLALKKFLTLSQPKNFIIYTDSLSAVESLRNKTFKIKNVKRFYNLLKKIPPQTQLVIAWVPSHVGVSGNEKADRLAKAALTLNLAAHSRVCWSNLKPRVDTYICTAWQALWNDQTRNKLYEIRPNLKESLCNTTQPLYRKQETVMTRLRIGHTWITHSYLLKKEDQPFCHACDNPFTVKHILVECSDFTHIRNKYYTTTDVHTLFREVDSSKITEYLKEIKLFDKI